MTKYFAFYVYVVLPFLFLSSCSTIRSGRYVRVKENDNLDKIAREFNVTVSEIKSVNKKNEFSRGEWVFIPHNRGILPHFFGKRVVYYEDFKNLGLFWPVPNAPFVSSEFGQRNGRNHDGIDIPAKIGKPFIAVDSGKVVYSGNGIKGYGNLIILSHNKGLFSVYAHANKNYVSKGESVYKGQVIGEVGNTGRSTGPHLHFEIRQRQEKIDPAPFYPKFARR